MRTIWVAALCLALSAAWAQEEAQPVSEETAQSYEQFLAGARKLSARMINQVVKQYDLNDSQRAQAAELIEKGFAEFLRTQGPAAFELQRRMEALQQFMSKEQAAWEDVPAEIRQDLARQAMPLIEAAEKHLSAFGDAMAGNLDLAQRAKLEIDRKKLQAGFEMARSRTKVELGQEAPSSQPSGWGRASRRRPQGSIAANPDLWEAYVIQFSEKYHLDEVQKAQAMDLLAKYKGKAVEAAQESAASAPAAPPASAPGGAQTPEQFRQRLEQAQSRRRPVMAVFQELVAELEKIPNAVQRRLAEEEAAVVAAPASQPAE